jgi:hypothetical protein
MLEALQSCTTTGKWIDIKEVRELERKQFIIMLKSSCSVTTWCFWVLLSLSELSVMSEDLSAKYMNETTTSNFQEVSALSNFFFNTNGVSWTNNEGWNSLLNESGSVSSVSDPCGTPTW